MKFLLALCAVFSCADAQVQWTASTRSNWVKFGENARMNGYYEPSPKLVQSNVVVSVMYDYKVEQVSPVSGKRYMSQKTQQEFDCAGARSRTVFFTWHESGMGNGAVVATGSDARAWEPNSPGSIARIVASLVRLS